MWAIVFRTRRLVQVWRLVFFLGVLFLVRWTKGAGVVDIYAFITRPLWPGPAQKEWIQSAADLESQTKLKLLEEDNRRLRGLLSLQASGGNKRISAAVISRSVRGWWQQIELSKGSTHGVRRGAAVLGPGGLIGRVESVTPSTSRVRLLTAPGSRIGVWVPRTQRHGLLIGVGTRRPQLVFLDKDPKVSAGDLISTSPASTLLPPNLPIGVVQSLNQKAQPSPQAAVQLIAAPEAIDWVQVQTI
ncbi:rod shape-determining protein MreC [Prochlorococcus sp. MIT 1300]|uniref:rod shape-determining protein MreC n=1 Tax=Prochlorococcus sp. MIT 1300 TaxID=3096218 RepID=UPI0039BFAE39